MDTNWIQVLQSSFQSLWVEVISFLPQLIVALVIIILGWIIGALLKRLIKKLFKALKIDQLLNAAGADKLVERSGHKLHAGAFVGILVKWFTIMVFFVAALDVLNLDQVTTFFRDDVLSYLPRVIVAVLIIFVAMIFANLVDKTIVAAGKAANFGSPDFLGNVAYYSILVFAALAVLTQLGIAPYLVRVFFTGFIFASSLAFGLAFGLGGKETAARYLEKLTRRN